MGLMATDGTWHKWLVKTLVVFSMYVLKILTHFIVAVTVLVDASDVVSHPGPKQQTDPPSIPVSELFPDRNYPEGQIMEYEVPKDEKDEWVSGQVNCEYTHLNISATIGGLLQELNCHCSLDGEQWQYLASSDNSVPGEGRRWWLKRWSE